MTTLLTSASVFLWALYIGPMIAFTVLFTLRSHIKSLTTQQLVRCFQAWGPGFGLSLGTLIFAILYLRWQQFGEFSLYWSTAHDQQQSIAILIGFVGWVSNLVLEVWTIDPLRKLDATPETPQYQAAFTKFRTHLFLHVLVWSVASFAFISSTLSISIR